MQSASNALSEIKSSLEPRMACALSIRAARGQGSGPGCGRAASCHLCFWRSLATPRRNVHCSLSRGKRHILSQLIRSVSIINERKSGPRSGCEPRKAAAQVCAAARHALSSLQQKQSAESDSEQEQKLPGAYCNNLECAAAPRTQPPLVLRPGSRLVTRRTFPAALRGKNAALLSRSVTGFSDIHRSTGVTCSKVLMQRGR